MLAAQGNLPEALQSYGDGQAIRERLAKSDPGNAGWQWAGCENSFSQPVPVTYRVLASRYAHMGRLDDAREIVRLLRTITPAVMESGARYRDPELRELFLSGLRLAAGAAG